MQETKHSFNKCDYAAPVVLRLGSSADLTAGGPTTQSESGENADSAFPNPTESS